MCDPFYNNIPHVNHDIRRKVERYQKKPPNLTFTQAYNKVFGTKYDEPREFVDTSAPQPKRKDDTSSASVFGDGFPFQQYK